MRKLSIFGTLFTTTSAGASLRRMSKICFAPIFFLLLVAGCAALSNTPTPQQRADNIEPVLSASGFKAMPADTEQKLQQITALPQLRVKYYPDKDGTLKYWMADAQFCHCIYVGDAAAYEKYRQYRLQQKIANQQEEAARMQMEAAQEMQMDMMNPWAFGPMWY